MTYPLVYADPSIGYRDSANAGKRGAVHKYQYMSPIENAVEIEKYAARDCTLFVWKCWPTHFEMHAALVAFGWKYRTVGFDWVKLTKTGKRHFGGGHWTRSNTEPCLIYTRGRNYPRRVRADVSMLVEAPVGKHSEKPTEVRDRIVRLMGDIPRIEMFARSRADGWDAHGNQLPPKRRKEAS